MQKSSESNDGRYKIVVLGHAGSGKSCVTIRFIANRFLEEHEPTIQDTYRKNMVFQDQPTVLDIFDTAGTEDFALVRDQMIRKAEGFLFVFALNDRQSYQEVIKIYDHIYRHHFDGNEDDRLPAILVGNKSDLADRTINNQEGKELADMLNIPLYIESSAKSGENIQSAFYHLVSLIQKRRNQQIEKLTRSNSVTSLGDKSSDKKNSSDKSKKDKCIIN